MAYVTTTTTRQARIFLDARPHLPPWPDAEQCCSGSDLDHPETGKTCWIAQGTAAIAWASVEAQILRCLRDRERDLYKRRKSSVGYSVNCYMAGFDKPGSRPVALIACKSKGFAKRIQELIEENTWWQDFRAERPAFGGFLHFNRQPSYLAEAGDPTTQRRPYVLKDSLAVGGLRQSGDQRSNHLLGAADSITWQRPYTVRDDTAIDGSIDYEGKLLSRAPITERPAWRTRIYVRKRSTAEFETTVFSSSGHGATPSRSTLGGFILIDDILYGLTVSHALSGSTESSSTASDSCSVGSWSDSEGSSKEDDQDTGMNSDTHSSSLSYGEVSADEIERRDGEYMLLGEIHSRSMGSPGDISDWALIRFAFPVHKNTLPVEHNFYAKVGVLPQTAGNTVFLVQNGNMLADGTLSARPSIVCLPGSRSPMFLYSVVTSVPLRKGDCGTWVFDIEGSWIGHIVAGESGSNIAYVATASRIVEDLKRHFKTESVDVFKSMFSNPVPGEPLISGTDIIYDTVLANIRSSTDVSKLSGSSKSDSNTVVPVGGDVHPSADQSSVRRGHGYTRDPGIQPSSDRAIDASGGTYNDTLQLRSDVSSGSGISAPPSIDRTNSVTHSRRSRFSSPITTTTLRPLPPRLPRPPRTASVLRRYRDRIAAPSINPPPLPLPPPQTSDSFRRWNRVVPLRDRMASLPQRQGHTYGPTVIRGGSLTITGDIYDPRGSTAQERLPVRDYESVYSNSDARLVPSDVPIEAVEMLFRRDDGDRSPVPRTGDDPQTPPQRG